MARQNLSILSDQAILEELGKRLETYRRFARMPDSRIFSRGGVKKDALAKFKKGKNISMLNWIKILRGANVLSQIETLFETPSLFSPLETLTEKTHKMPQRIRQKKTPQSSFQWGDE